MLLPEYLHASVLRLVVQRGIEVGALLQVFLGVAEGGGFTLADFNLSMSRQGNRSRNGRSGDDREEIEVHGADLEVCGLKWPLQAVVQTYAAHAAHRNSLQQ
ncbi:hypothetical protein D3C77_650290 [compost metagenome]